VAESDSLPAHVAMSEDDARAWDALNDREQRPRRQILSGKVRDRLRRSGEVAKERFDALPGVERFEELLINALGGLTDFGSRVARASLRPEAVVRAYQKRGFVVDSIGDIRNLELRDIESVKPRLDLAYITASTAQGAATGLAVSGGQIVAAGGAVFGAGAGAAPGAGVVIGAMAADAAAVLVASQRAVAHVAAYYGYDIDRDEEKLFALGVLGVGTAPEMGKAAAYIELNKIVQGLARRQTWKQLNDRVVTKIVSKVYARLGMRLTQRKLGQAVPIVGVLIGAGLNARMLSRVVDDAEYAYRKRFLQEKYGLMVGEPDLAPMVEQEDTISVAEIVEAEIVAQAETDGTV
jgi:hypothetical protein